MPTTPAPDETTYPRPWRGRVVALVGLIMVALNARIMVAVVSPIIGLITADLPLSTTHESVIGLAAPLCFALFGAIAPPLGRRYGLEAMMVVSLLISAAGEALRALAHTPAGFVWWTIPALAGAGIGNVLTPPLIKKYFPDRQGLIMAVFTFFVTISTALPPLVILTIAEANGWRFSVGVWALLGVVAVVPWLVQLFSPGRAGRRLAAVKRRLDPRTTHVAPPRLGTPLWTTGVAWALTTVFAINSLLGYTMFPWLPHLLRDAGVSVPAAAMYLAVFTAGSLPGSIIVPLVVARIKRHWVLPVVFFLGYAVSYIGLTVSPGVGTMAWILISRIGDGFYPYALTMINLRTRTTRGSIALSGFIQPIGYTLAALGPWGFGFLRTLTGTWAIPMVALLVLLPIQLVAGLIVGRSKPIDV